MRATLAIIDTELEVLPKELAHGAKLRASSDALFGKRDVILDHVLHADIVRSMSDGNRRGRPDILHHALSLAISSIPYRLGYIDVVVHTRNNEAISFEPKAQVPQNYFEFLRLLGDLYSNGQVDCRDRKWTLEPNRDLKQIIARSRADVRVLMCQDGEVKGLGKLLKGFDDKNAIIMFGGFAEGDFKSPVKDLADISVSLGPELLNINAVTAEILRSLPY
jgi:rRNA small subunit pseudouridine methyltransferase Nep1